MADLLGQDLLATTSHTVTQAKQAVMQAAVTCPPLEGVSYMHAILAAVIAAAVMGTAGYLIGKRGITKTQSDLTNALKQIQALPKTIQTAPATIEHEIKTHEPKL